MIRPTGDGTFTRNGGKVEVVLGRDDLEEVTANNVHQIETVTVHKEYVSVDQGDDIALIRIATPWKGSVARLSLSSADDPMDAKTYAAGFGNLEQDQAVGWKTARNGALIRASSTTLQEVSLPIVATAACRAAYQVKFKNAKIGSEQVCAGYDRGRQDTCNGDSGGPLVFYDADNCPVQLGVVSWGDGCAQPNAYGIYSRVSAYRDWIVQHAPEVAAAAAREVKKPPPTAIADQTLAAALQQLENAIPSAKGRIRISTSGGKRLKLKSTISITADSDVSGRLVLLDVNASGEVVQIFPNRHVTDESAKFITGGKSASIPDAANPAYGGTAGFQVTEPLGRSRLIGIVAPQDVQIADIVDAPERIAKGFAKEGAPVSYLSNLFDRLLGAAAASPRGAADQSWALGETAYDVIP
jgi:Trypsin/Domain of unknown function (DUF4384)